MCELFCLAVKPADPAAIGADPDDTMPTCMKGVYRIIIQAVLVTGYGAIMVKRFSSVIKNTDAPISNYPQHSLSALISLPDRIGGPFRNLPAAQFSDVTPEQACAHPNWSMGRKISVDSATLMNKGLEVIEARWLFNAHPDQIEVLVHPQSIVHSMVAYRDGSVLAQMGTPDMRTPIAHALAWPRRIEAGVERLNLAQMNDLSFEKPDLARFPCLGLAFQAMRNGASAPVTLNAANEVAVDAFLDGRIGFEGIARLVGDVMERTAVTGVQNLDDVLEHDRQARQTANEWVANFNG